MPKVGRWVHFSLEVVGVLAIIAGLGWVALWAIGQMFKDFAGGNCTDTEERIVASPDGKRTFKSFHRECGGTYDFYSVYLSTGNPNPGYEYVNIAELKNVAAGQVSVRWDSSDQLSIDYPQSAKIEDVYANVLGVRVVLHPPLTIPDKSIK